MVGSVNSENERIRALQDLGDISNGPLSLSINRERSVAVFTMSGSCFRDNHACDVLLQIFAFKIGKEA